MLENKVAIITGSSSGIGLKLAEEFLKNGAFVTICGTNEEKLKNALNILGTKDNQNKILKVKADVSNTDDVKKLFALTYETFGKIDILINNAGIAPSKPMEDMTDEDFEKVLNINTIGTFKCTREAIKYMKENGGSIINTSSFVGLYGSPNQAAYTASKYAVNGLTKSNAKELGKYNIRVNAIAPGVVMTDMVKDNCNEDTIKRLNMMTPLGRGAEPSDLVGAYLYLASDSSIFTTGAIINIDGGLVM